MSIHRPTTTPFPDEILDYWLGADDSGAKRLSESELRCLCYVVRHTFGYGKNLTGDAISLTQFHKGIRRADETVVDWGCGLKHRTGIIKALRGLEAKGLIKRTHRTSVHGDEDVTLYALDVDQPPSPRSGHAGGSANNAPPPASRVVRSMHQGSANDALGVVRSTHQGGANNAPTINNVQETTIQQTTNNKHPLAPANVVALRAHERERAMTDYERIIDALRVHMGWPQIPPSLQKKWAVAGETLIRDYGAQDVIACIAWLFSNDWWRENAVKFNLSKIADVIEDWRARGRPTHVPPEHHGKAQFAKKPRLYTPIATDVMDQADHLALAEDIRRFKGDEAADDYLREHGLLRADNG